jgi:hypothetical protein
MLTTPRWQTPWYRRDAGELNLWAEADTLSQDHEQSGSSIVKKSVSITTANVDGEHREYSSMEEVPTEIRSEIEAFQKEAIQGKGDVMSAI